MPGTRLPAVRIPPPGQGADDETLDPDSVIVDLPSHSKFGFTWPNEQPMTVPLPLAAERPVTLSSSEGETDMSDEEFSAPVRRQPKPEDFGGDSEFITPTSHLNVEQNPMEQAGQLAQFPRRLSRAFSTPLPSQLGFLQNPRRSISSSGESENDSVGEQVEIDSFRELSLELADSVQMVIQTLLQLSPPQVLDPAKEQFSACSLSIPTPSISAMFTSMKNLNYMSANMATLGLDIGTELETSLKTKASGLSMIENDFDIGETLQSVGDALSGVAAQAGVDLVLFHGDVGLKHIAVKGDESGLSYTLSHVVRQIIASSRRGDTVEVGLFIETIGEDQGVRVEEGSGSSLPLLPAALGDDVSIRCSFHISHKYMVTEQESLSELNTQEPPLSPRVDPAFDTFILRRLLRHVGASLDKDPQSKGAFLGHLYEFTIVLDPGDPIAINPTVTISPPDAAILGFPDMQIANEPTFEELVAFAESLRGKSVTLHANSKGSFAHHLTSYLTTWGMDVSHMSTEPDADGEYTLVGEPIDPAPSAPVLDFPTPSVGEPPSITPPNGRRNVNDPVFILIDDDVGVLRNRLSKIKAEYVYPLSLHTRKRPSLASNHRPRSSPQVARLMGITNPAPPPSPVVIVHFTSLCNFKLVKDTLQTVLTPSNGPSMRIPEVIVIPKPAGPRRFLTALHTAVTRPVVDPFFVPTATSPISPGLHSISPFFSMTGGPKSPSGRSTSTRASDKSTRSPREFGAELNTGHAPPSPLGHSSDADYFPDTTMKLGSVPASGLLIQSPDGQPTGIFFHPKPKSSPQGVSTPSERAQANREAVRHRPYSRASDSEERGPSKPTHFSATSPVPPSRTLRPAPVSLDSSDSTGSTSSKGKGRQSAVSHSEEHATQIIEQSIASAALASPDPSQQQSNTPNLSRRHSQQTSPPASPQTRAVQGPGGTRRINRRSSGDANSSASTPKKSKPGGDGNIVPPICVLIVDDNPINQTILSTFMKKKKIKYDVAKNGEEAVHKWRSGIFHLILMDIQMPVMDGIQATKEIRRIEKQSGAGGFPSTPQSEGQRTPSEASADSRAVATPPYRSSVIIVALTASSLQTDRVAALAAGCNDFLTKPVSLEWLNSKIIEWGSIKALQMWADIRPEVVKSISTGQAAQAQQVARRLHVPEGRSTTPSGERVRAASSAGRRTSIDVSNVPAADRHLAPHTPSLDDPPALSSYSSMEPTRATASSSNPLNIAFTGSASEAALGLASAHRPQPPPEDAPIPADAAHMAVIPPPPGANIVPPVSESSTALPTVPELSPEASANQDGDPSAASAPDEGPPPASPQPEPQ